MWPQVLFIVGRFLAFKALLLRDIDGLEVDVPAEVVANLKLIERVLSTEGLDPADPGAAVHRPRWKLGAIGTGGFQLLSDQQRQAAQRFVAGSEPCSAKDALPLVRELLKKPFTELHGDSWLIEMRKAISTLGEDNNLYITSASADSNWPLKPSTMRNRLVLMYNILHDTMVALGERNDFVDRGALPETETELHAAWSPPIEKTCQPRPDLERSVSVVDTLLSGLLQAACDMMKKLRIIVLSGYMIKFYYGRNCTHNPRDFDQALDMD